MKCMESVEGTPRKAASRDRMQLKDLLPFHPSDPHLFLFSSVSLELGCTGRSSCSLLYHKVVLRMKTTY